MFVQTWEEKVKMLKYITPDFYADSINEVPFENLKKADVKGLIIDLDNTITYWNSDSISDEVLEWFKEIKNLEFCACLLSNNKEDRVAKIANILDVPYVANAGKPRVKSFKNAMDKIGTNKDNTAVIGDQVFTDVLGGNRLELFTVLVVPMGTREFLGTRVVRIIERAILKFILSRRVNNT